MPLEIIGTGMSRTGTMSTRTALETLGLGPCHHMMELFANPQQVDVWTQVATGKTHDWESVFAGYTSQVDFPGGRVWQQTIEAFPAAKVIHTERPEDDWWASFSKTVLKVWTHHATLTRNMPQHIKDIFVTLTPFYIDDTFGGLPDKDMALDAYRRNNRLVREIVPADRLLVFTPSDGWAPLCNFLGTPIPATPFPKSNGRDEFWDNFDQEPA
uniref:sulfotransferase family protein n=1 Tax=Yoonia sp. TaxID=2212373 RepID=UPI004048A8FD|tara:strand:+ start:169 stop:807 length:639 start_codon:yes stop_codon:yes gene_type:complete